MRLAAVAAFALVVLAGCATGVRQRTEVMSFTSDDGAWTLSALMLVAQRAEADRPNDACGLGHAKSVLLNNGKTPIGGSFIVTVASKTGTIGEFTVHCQIALPGGSASCAASSFTRRLSACGPQDVHLYARPAIR